MGLFKKLFGSESSKSVNPDNTKLLHLLEVYQRQNRQGDSYKDVVLELMNGNSFLLLTSEHDGSNSDSWRNTEKDTTLKLTCIFNMDGLKVLGAFTDEKALFSWAKKSTRYTGLPSKDVLLLCEKNQIDRIIINSNLPNMFVLERNRANIKTETIHKETTVELGAPNKPLDNRIIKKLIEQIKRVDTIEEVYQYGQTKDDEFSIVLGFKLSTASDNARTATLNAVQTTLEGENIDQLLDVFIIEDEGWYKSIKNIQDSLIYKKQ
jgi:hypothetical protein